MTSVPELGKAGNSSNGSNNPLKRAIIKITGRVQGIGFRPFVFRLAQEYRINGFVYNDLEGVTIDAEGTDKDLKAFIACLESKKPPLALIQSITQRFENPLFYQGFTVRESEQNPANYYNKDKNGINESRPNINISPDIAICGKCLKEFADPENRRYLYPFINCTDCGPRFTIIKELPYDRSSTAMNKFKMCPLCEKEYKNPIDRRFHAEPNSCFSCGPQLEFIINDTAGVSEVNAVNQNFGLRPIIDKNIVENTADKSLQAVKLAVDMLRAGEIVAVKGVGGFHLMCDASGDAAVKLLRERKDRPRKPFAVMFKDIETLSKYAYLNNGEYRFDRNSNAGAETRERFSSIIIDMLDGKEKPIVLLPDRGNLSWFVNCGLKHIGAFLPYAPLHYIILNLFGGPLVATSANIGGEPIIKDNGEAFSKLKNLADGFLVHNRDILQRCDDSVVKPAGENMIFIRRSRGFVPDPFKVPLKLKRNVLATGSFLKNTFAIAYPVPIPLITGNAAERSYSFSFVIPSQHNGDLDSVESFVNFTENIYEFERLYDFKPDIIVCDKHPDYENTKWAKKESEKSGIKYVSLQHHRAHIISCMAENGIKLETEVLGIAFDGSGLGDDGSIWGGEFFKGKYMNLERIGSFRPFRLLGGEKAVKSPRRILLSLLFDSCFEEFRNQNKSELTDCNQNNYIDKLAALTDFTIKDIKLFLNMWEKGINSPYSSSCGRIFDAVACLCGFTRDISYEGEAAVYLEDLCVNTSCKNKFIEKEYSEYFDYRIDFDSLKNLYIVDYMPMINRIAELALNPTIFDAEKIANGFINTLALIICDMAVIFGYKKVCMSGGVFQNSALSTKAVKILKDNGFTTFVNKNIPPNDGGLSFGQAVFGGLI